VTSNDKDEIESGASRRPGELLRSYLELSKARLASFVVLTAVVGYLLAARGSVRLDVLSWTAIGTALSAFGANILNQLFEADRDKLMERTRGRPLPAGRVSRAEAATWGIVSAIVGLAVLAAGTNLLTAALSLFVILLYIAVYTPLKVRTPFNTAVGAVCGAVPPMMGWTAGAGRLDLGAWILFGLLFFWQVPHFLSLAWLYREDYQRGGFKMMPAVDPRGDLTGRLSLLYAAGLLPITATLCWTGMSGSVFLAVSQVVGVGFAALGWKFLRGRTERAARRLFLASLVYLPLVLLVLVSDSGDPPARRDSSPEKRVVEVSVPTQDETRHMVEF
jgi:protoheme IX farnesyltransferase